MKKIVSVTLIVAFLVVFVTGCGNSEATTKEAQEDKADKKIELENVEVEKTGKESKERLENESQEAMMKEMNGERPEYNKDVKREITIETK